MTTKLFLDCEFTGLVKSAELISLCLYLDDSCYFYAEFNDFDSSILSEWHLENVISKLRYHDLEMTEEITENVYCLKGAKSEITNCLLTWLQRFGEIEIWGDVPVYDWVLFCDLFGGALSLPKQIFYMPMDLATLAKIKLGNANFRRFDLASYGLTDQERESKHNAFVDAKVELLCYQKLLGL